MADATHAPLAVYDLSADVGHYLVSADPLKRALAGWLTRYTGATLRHYGEDIELFFEWCEQVGLPPLQATRGHMELYLRHLEQRGHFRTGRPLAKATISRRFGTVAVFYQFAAFDDIIAKDPCVGVTRPKVRKSEQHRPAMSPLALGIFLEAAELHSPPAHALIALLGGRGLRVNEACSLDISDVTNQGGYDHISFTGKGNKRETIVLAVPVGRAVRAAIGDRTEGPVLLNKWGLRMKRSNAARLIHRIAEAAVLPANLTPHSFRRAFVMTLLASGVDLRDVQIAARHEKPETTADYDVRARTADRDASHRLLAVLAGMRG